MIPFSEIKKHVWKIYGGENEFKKDFPLRTNRNTIYRRVQNGKSVLFSCRVMKENFTIHENAQRNKKTKYLHTIKSR